MYSESSVQQNCPYVDKDDRWSSHTYIRAWLAALPADARILDVGAASGTVGRLSEGRRFVLNGLEPNTEWADIARPYYAAFWCGTLDNAPNEFLRGHTGIVCADVIEHMANPESSLQRLLELQAEGCSVFVSVPNVANVWVRLNVLFGRFDYTDRGILDRTHLRFFTRRTLVASLTSMGLQIKQIQVTPIPLNLVHPFFQRKALGRLLHAGLAQITTLLPTLLGYQFVVHAVKPRLEDQQI